MRKTLFTLWALLCLFSAKAQLPDSIPGSFFKYITDPLDLTQVPTGFLLEREPTWGYIHRFDGVFDTVNTFENWKQQYWDIYRIKVNPNITLPDYDTIKNLALKIEEDLGATPLPILFFNYNYIKPTAIDDNLLDTLYSRFYDVPGRTSSPYLQKTLFSAAAANEEGYGIQQNFIIDSRLFFSNISSDVSFSVNFVKAK